MNYFTSADCDEWDVFVCVMDCVRKVCEENGQYAR